jgi:hypothetical protein
MMRQMNKEASLDDVLNGFRNDAQNEMQQDNKNQNRNYQTVGNNDAR